MVLEQFDIYVQKNLTLTLTSRNTQKLTWKVLWVTLCPLPIHMLETLQPIPQNVTVYGNMVIADIISYDEIIL